MNFIKKIPLKQTAVLVSVLLFSANAVMAAGFLDKIKVIEKGVATITKPPKVQADVGGVKIDPTKCNVKTGVKVADNASKKKTDGKCGSDSNKDAPEKVTAQKKQQSNDEYEDNSPDR